MTYEIFVRPLASSDVDGFRLYRDQLTDVIASRAVFR